MEQDLVRELRDRMAERVAAWGIVVEHTIETESSMLVFGRRGAQPVVLKVVGRDGDEWRSGDMLRAFRGRGVVRLYDAVEGAVLLERLTPGSSLAHLALGGADEAATRILADVIRQMSPRGVAGPVPTVQEWGTGFEAYAASGDTRISTHLVQDAQRLFSELCATQGKVRLLHGDLHHHNVLFDAGRDWVAIDPKGVIGEVEYEIGAALRNPHERPELYSDPAVIRRRVECLARGLGLDAERMLAWAFAQAVLSIIWRVEDGLPLQPDDGRIALARVLCPLLHGFV